MPAPAAGLALKAATSKKGRRLLGAAGGMVLAVMAAPFFIAVVLFGALAGAPEITGMPGEGDRTLEVFGLEGAKAIHAASTEQAPGPLIAATLWASVTAVPDAPAPQLPLTVLPVTQANWDQYATDGIDADHEASTDSLTDVIATAGAALDDFASKVAAHPELGEQQVVQAAAWLIGWDPIAQAGGVPDGAMVAAMTAASDGQTMFAAAGMDPTGWVEGAGGVTTGSGSTFVDAGTGNGWGGHANGKIPEAELCPLPSAPGQRLRCDAATAFAALTAAYRLQFGTDIQVTDSYRSYAEQVEVKRSKGYLAAVPGTSNHGWGLAVDLGGGINSYGTPQYAWMKGNGATFGFFHPTWAEPGHPDYRKSEPWHWQYVPGTTGTTAQGGVSGNRAIGQQLAAARGWTGDQWSCLEQLWTKESGWNHLAANPTSSAYGIPQALPGSKMAAAGADWATNPATQITWGLDYITGRYATPCGAWAFWQAHSWY